MESMACGIVSDTTSPSGLETSATSSFFLVAFLGTMVVILDQKPVYKEKCIKLDKCDSLQR
jgi:hypothetical protein